MKGNKSRSCSLYLTFFIYLCEILGCPRFTLYNEGPSFIWVIIGFNALKGGKWTPPQVPCKDSSTSHVYIVHKVIGFNHKDCHKLNYPI